MTKGDGKDHRIYTPQLIDVCRKKLREVGYALTVHGSMTRDIDFVAVPWTDEAIDALEVVEVVRAAAQMITGDAYISDGPTTQPFGRLSWAIALWDGPKYIDLSVTPKGAA